MATSLFAGGFGAAAAVFRRLVGGVSTEIPAVTLVDSDGNEVSVGGGGTSQVQGTVANDGVDAGNPVKIGGRASDSFPTTVGTGDRVDAWFTRSGAAMVGALRDNGVDGRANTMGLMVSSSPGNADVMAIYSHVFNGTTWDRQRGDVAGSDAVIAPRATAGGATQYRRMATADTNLAVIKASAGRPYGYVITNNTASAKFVKLYNKATAPVLASDVPLRTIMVPANGIAAYHIGMGLAGFSSGIAIAATGAPADTDATALAANDLIIQVDYA